MCCKVPPMTGRFPYKVGIHQSCHALRGLRLASSSELVGPSFSKMRYLLEKLDGITFSELERPDECCGFGGTFSINEEAVSSQMGVDRLADHVRAGTQVLTAPGHVVSDASVGTVAPPGHAPAVMHIAEILAGRHAFLMGVRSRGRRRRTVREQMERRDYGSHEH